MKKIVLFLLAFLTFTMGANAQNNVQLNIHHKLGDMDFAFDTGAKNNMDQAFNVSRLQYYISEISIIHDGGTETAIEDLFVLVNASLPTEVDLGNHDITDVEAIHFHIGVDPDFNHTDPASYPNGHPLAPVFPSMHWGWAAGYRFIAIEGQGGSSFNQLYQLHGLGDDNYFKTEVPVEVSAENGEVKIDLDGDYTRVLENIAVKNGVIVHGDYGDAKKALENFRDYVFSPTQVASSTVDFSEVSRFDVYPNPAANGVANIAINATEDLFYQVSVSDILGRRIQYFNQVQSNGTIAIEVEQPGVYIVNLIKGGEAVIAKRWVVSN